jgi:hypothetical protein
MIKYAVLKWEDWEAMGVSPAMEEARIKDAEVLRLKDITSGPAFYTYASVLLTYAEIFEMLPESKNLREIADHFFDAAQRADNYPGKRLPD